MPITAAEEGTDHPLRAGSGEQEIKR